MTPNMYTGMANNAALLDAYTHSCHSFKDQSGFTPRELASKVFKTSDLLNEMKRAK